MDWQSRMLRRVSEGSDALNKNRVVLYFADECQKYIVSGSQEAGDPNFMSLSRESRVIHICATQSEAWVLLSPFEGRSPRLPPVIWDASLVDTDRHADES